MAIGGGRGTRRQVLTVLTVAVGSFGSIRAAESLWPSTTEGSGQRTFVLTPEMFGASPDQADHSDSFEAMAQRIEPGAVCRLSGEYRLSRMIQISGKSGFSIVGPGSVSMLARTPVEWGYGMLRFAECENFRLEDLVFDANRMAREPREVSAHTLHFQSSKRFACKRVETRNSVCDGFFLDSTDPADFDTHCSDADFLDCLSVNSYRQGCSVIQGHRLRFLGGEYSGSIGTAPQAGIDLESDSSDPRGALSDIHFERVRFSGNVGFGLKVAPIARPASITARDCSFDANAAGAISWGAVSGAIIRPTISRFGPEAERGAIDFPVGDGFRTDEPIEVAAPVFTDIATDSPQATLVYVHSQAHAPVAISNLRAGPCAGIVGLHRDTSSLVNSVIEATLGTVDGAIGVAGNDCQVAGNSVAGFFGSLVVVTGDRAAIVGNEFRNARRNDERGAIRILGDDALVTDNVVAIRAGVTAIRLEGRIGEVKNNRVSGFAQMISRTGQRSSK